MPPHCCVVTCKNKGGSKSSKDDAIGFHKFPRDSKIRQQWIEATGHRRGWTPFSHSYTICSEHFEDKCYQEAFRRLRRLHEWAVPTLKLPDKAQLALLRPEKLRRNEKKLIRGGHPPDPSYTDKKCQHVLIPKNMCIKCKKEFNPPNSDWFLGGRARSIVAHIYDFFEYEFNEIKHMYGNRIDCSPFGKLLHRTADATGISLPTINTILKEDHDWNEKRDKTRRKRWTKNKSSKKDSDASKNTREYDYDSDYEYPRKITVDSGTQTESFDINENEITTPTKDTAKNVDSVKMDTQPEVTSKRKKSISKPAPTHAKEKKKKSERKSTELPKQPLKTTEEEYSSKVENDAVPMELNVVITQEEFFKTHKNGLEPDEEVVTLETEDVEFEFHDAETLDEPEKQSDAAPVPQAVDTQPIVNTEPQYYSLEQLNPMVNQINGTIVSTEPQYCSLETINPPLARSEPQYYSLDPVNNIMRPLGGTLVSAKPQYGSLEAMDPMAGQTNSLQMGGQRLFTTEPRFCSLEANNAILRQPAHTHVEARPLVLTDQLYCSMNPTMQGNTIIGQPNPMQTQPLMTNEQYLRPADGQTMAILPRADFTDGVNYYVMM